MMGIDYITHLLVHESNDTDLWIAYNRASGARLSAMEHLVPEQMFSTEDNPAHGISAVKAIQIADAEGQKIWTITQANLSTALAAINLPSAVENDIRNSVYAGMEVTAHEQPVNFYGTSQVGYIVLDPETGAGGYLIGGGENGGYLIYAYTEWFWMTSIATEGYGRLRGAKFLIGLGKYALALLANMMTLLNNLVQSMLSCITSGAGWIKTLLVMSLSVVTMSMLYLFSIVSVGGVGVMNFLLFSAFEYIKRQISNLVGKIGC